VADEIPASTLGCPASWKPFLMPGSSETERNLFAVRWVNPPGAEFLQVATALRNVALRIAALARAAQHEREPDARAALAAGRAALRRLSRPAAAPVRPGVGRPTPGDSIAAARDSLANPQWFAADTLRALSVRDSLAGHNHAN
jgi:hypothetical protein